MSVRFCESAKTRPSGPHGRQLPGTSHFYANPVRPGQRTCLRWNLCGSLISSDMRRAQAILVLVALASLPLVLLGQPSAPSACDGKCCIRQGAAHSGAGSSHDGMSCHHGLAGHIFQCGMNSKSQSQPAFLAPLPSTMLSGSLAVPIPVLTRRAVVRDSQAALSGLLPAPFKPPRA